MPDKKPPFKPTRTFDVSLRIKDLDYSADLVSIRFVSSLTAMFQVVIIKIYVDPNEMISRQVYGQDSVKLIVSYIGQSAESTQAKQFEFDLLCLKTDFQITQSANEQMGIHKDRAQITMITVCKIGYTIMTRNVNAVYGVVDSKKTIKLALEDLTTKAGGKLKIDTDGLYKSNIDQVVIPPSTYGNALKYLDGIWGIYDGVLGTFCQYDGTVHIMNLTSRIKKNADITIHSLTLTGDKEDLDKFLSSTDDGKTFFTSQKIKTENSSNTIFGVYGQTLKHIVKPKDSLSYTITQNLNDLCSKYGLVDKNSDMHVNQTVDRIKYYNEHSGVDYDDTFAKSLIAKKISDMSSINITLDSCMRFQKLLEVGSCIKLKSGSLDHAGISSSYILNVSDISLSKNPDWHVTANLKCIRSNKSSI